MRRLGSVGRVLEGEVAAASNKQQGGDKATLGGQGMKGGDEEVTDTVKAYAEKTSEVKVDAKKIELPPTSSTLYVSSGFSDQFLKLSFDSSLVSTVKDTTDAEINSLLEVKIQSEVPYIQSPSMCRVPLRVAKLEKDVSELKKIDLSTKTLVALKTQVPFVVDNYLGSKVRNVFQKELKKHTANLIQKYSLQQILELPKKHTSTVDLEQESEKSPSKILKIKKEQIEKQKMPKFNIKSTDKAALKEYDQKSALYQTMYTNKSFNRNPANHRLYHALTEELIEDENAMDKGVADTVQDHERKHDDDEDDDDEDPLAGPNQGKKTKRRITKESESSKKPSTTKETPKGKASSKGSKTSKSVSAKEPVEEPIAEVVMDDASDDVVHDDEQPQDASEPKTTKTPNLKWFTQPPRPPTPDPEWNKRQVVLDQPEQPWFNQWSLLQSILLHLTTSWPLRLTSLSHPGHLTVAVDYFFNNDLEYLKSSNPKRTYTTSITKSKATRYEIEGIEDMVPTLWSPTKVGSQLNKFSKNNVYSTKKILGVKSVSVKKLHGYGHLEEIVMKRADQSYQKKLNITPPQQTFPEIELKELYTPSHKPPGVIYEDLAKQKRVMRVDKLYMFWDEMLMKVWDELHYRIHDFHLEYNKEMPRRK
ncbi:hypothetical protein Tco_1164221 [Tanacetum coccineum]